MRLLRSTLAIGLVAVVGVACGSPAATQGPAAATQGAGGDTPAPVATEPGGGGPTTNPGGGGNIGGGSGQIHIEIGGPAQQVVDEPFFAIGSRFGGAAGVQLNFTDDGDNGIAGITGIDDAWTISWTSEALSVNSADCQLSNWNIGATSGSGAFDCKNGFGVKPDGTYLTGVTMKGSFQASQ
jgi:hypothetical protein